MKIQFMIKEGRDREMDAQQDEQGNRSSPDHHHHHHDRQFDSLFAVAEYWTEVADELGLNHFTKPPEMLTNLFGSSI